LLCGIALPRQIMRSTLFISDLHLCDARPDINALFFRFLNDVAANARSLYILGDLFEYWVGDDQLDHDPLARRVCDGLHALSSKGVTLYFMHGNRDFLLGERFASEAGLKLLTDPTEISIGDMRFLLLHGDTLCTDDAAYQQWRAQSRATRWQNEFLQKSFSERNAIANSIRQQSNSAKSLKAEEIMDASESAIAQTFREKKIAVMIHGHTHRPAHHIHRIDEQVYDRWVLRDWYRDGGYLRLDATTGEFKSETIA
jgi:UDP-2,3-diacylglucosamine hydrolase